MANAKIRSCSFFVNGTKMGYIENVEYDYSTNDEAQFGDPGYVGHSDGAGMTKIKAGGIIPVPGIGLDVFAIMKSRQTVTVSLGVVNGQVHTADMRITQISVRGSQKNGSLTGEFSFEGGEPTFG